MKKEQRIDTILRRIMGMNELVDLRVTDDQIDEDGISKKKKSSGGLFSAAVGEMFFRRSGDKRLGILSLSEPSDGHPQEELTPDFNWFRPLTFNNRTWTLYWPELII